MQIYRTNVLLILSVILLLSAKSYAAKNNFQFENKKISIATEKNPFITQDIAPEHYFDNVIEVKFKTKPDLNYASKKSVARFLSNSDQANLLTASAPYDTYTKKGSTIHDEYGISRIVEMRFKEAIDPIQKCIELMQNPEVEYATPVFKRKVFDYTPNDPAFSNQYALKNMQVAKAWDITKGSPDVVIAIVDSGVEWDHSDLADNIWINEDEIPDNGKDDDNNGKIDDYRGWDMVGNISVTDYQSGIWREDNNPKSTVSDHGTFCSGCASAVTDNANGIAGVGFNTKIMAIKCAADNAQLSTGILRGYQGILYAAQNGADVINCSWGGQGTSPTEQDVVNTATKMGSVIVSASGNDGVFNDLVPQYPANYENVLSVGATGANNSPVNFSNWGNSVHVYAGGDNVYSTTLNNKYKNASGTSFSSPYTAGMVALIKSIHPDWTPQQLIKQVRATADPIAGLTEANRPYYVGTANAFKAVQYNNPDYPQLKIPGFITESIDYSGASGLTKIGESNITLKLRNLLEEAENVKIEISVIDDFISLDKSVENFAIVEADESLDLDLTVNLAENTPWYSGSARILLKYTAPNYIDYEVVNINLNLPTQNRFTDVYPLNPNYQIYWYGSGSPSKSTTYMVGSSELIGTLLFSSINGNLRLSVTSQTDDSYCMHAFDNSNIVLGYSLANSTSYLKFSSNGGQTWGSNISTTNFTPFINSIHFYDDNNGIMLGDPINSMWGIATTTNGGQSWSAKTATPAPQATETGFVESVYFLNNKIWFGTSTGRVFYSDNKGQTFSVSPNVLGNSAGKIAFLDEQNGYALYSTGTTENRIYYLASTVNGGRNWKTNVFNFSANGINPVALYVVPEQNKVAVLDAFNRVFSSGTGVIKFEPVLTRQLLSTNYGTAIVEGSSVRLWSAAANGIGFLDYNEKSAVDKKSLTSLDGNSWRFDTLSVGGGKMQRLQFQNNGTLPLTITDLIINVGANTTEEEFTTTTQPHGEIQPFETASMFVFFRPKSPGEKSAVLSVKSDADNGDVKLNLSGFAIEETSVQEFADAGIKLYPNPAKSEIHIDLGNKLSGGTIEITDILGNQLIQIDLNHNLQTIPVNDLPAGKYFVRLTYNSQIYTDTFVKE